MHSKSIQIGDKMTIHTAKPKRVVIMPATKRTAGIGNIRTIRHLRVAAYCRVSTDDVSQQTSYNTQKTYYESYISTHPGWEFAGIFADEAASGTSTVHRNEFNHMIQCAMRNEFDYIVTKSISRFARNTLDTLRIIRELRTRTPPVGVYFEKENLDTMDAAGELVLTIMSALAQEESRSISENIRWSIRKNFERGIPVVNPDRMLGYRKGEHGEWLEDEEEAPVVRHIFDLFINGTSASAISKLLNAEGYVTALGNPFRADGVLTILRNEKYTGDLLMQKTVTEDFLTHRSVKNEGLAPQYYVKDHHIALIDQDSWILAQNILSIRAEHKVYRGRQGRGRTAGGLGCVMHCDMQGNESEMVRCTYRIKTADHTSVYIPVWRLPGSSREYIKEKTLISAYEQVLCQCRKQPETVMQSEPADPQEVRTKQLFLSLLESQEIFSWKLYLPFIRKCILQEINGVRYVTFLTNFHTVLKTQI